MDSPDPDKAGAVTDDTVLYDGCASSDNSDSSTAPDYSDTDSTCSWAMVDKEGQLMENSREGSQEPCDDDTDVGGKYDAPEVEPVTSQLEDTQSRDRRMESIAPLSQSLHTCPSADRKNEGTSDVDHSGNESSDIETLDQAEEETLPFQSPAASIYDEELAVLSHFQDSNIYPISLVLGQSSVCSKLSLLEDADKESISSFDTEGFSVISEDHHTDPQASEQDDKASSLSWDGYDEQMVGSEQLDLTSLPVLHQDKLESLKIKSAKKYVHHPNKRLNMLLNFLLTLSVTAVLGLGIGNFLGWSSFVVHQQAQSEKLHSLESELVTCITGDEGQGGDDQDLDDRVIKQLWNDNVNLRHQLDILQKGSTAYNFGNGKIDSTGRQKEILLKEKVNQLLNENGDLQREVARLRYSHLPQTKHTSAIQRDELNQLLVENQDLRLQIAKLRYGQADHHGKAASDGVTEKKNSFSSEIDFLGSSSVKGQEKPDPATNFHLHVLRMRINALKRTLDVKKREVDICHIVHEHGKNSERTHETGVTGTVQRGKRSEKSAFQEFVSFIEESVLNSSITSIIDQVSLNKGSDALQKYLAGGNALQDYLENVFQIFTSYKRSLQTTLDGVQGIQSSDRESQASDTYTEEVERDGVEKSVMNGGNFIVHPEKTLIPSDTEQNGKIIQFRGDKEMDIQEVGRQDIVGLDENKKEEGKVNFKEEEEYETVITVNQEENRDEKTIFKEAVTNVRPLAQEGKGAKSSNFQKKRRDKSSVFQGQKANEKSTSQAEEMTNKSIFKDFFYYLSTVLSNSSIRDAAGRINVSAGSHILSSLQTHLDSVLATSSQDVVNSTVNLMQNMHSTLERRWHELKSLMQSQVSQKHVDHSVKAVSKMGKTFVKALWKVKNFGQNLISNDKPFAKISKKFTKKWGHIKEKLERKWVDIKEKWNIKAAKYEKKVPSFSGFHESADFGAPRFVDERTLDKAWSETKMKKKDSWNDEDKYTRVVQNFGFIKDKKEKNGKLHKNKKLDSNVRKYVIQRDDDDEIERRKYENLNENEKTVLKKGDWHADEKYEQLGKHSVRSNDEERFWKKFKNYHERHGRKREQVALNQKVDKEGYITRKNKRESSEHAKKQFKTKINKDNEADIKFIKQEETRELADKNVGGFRSKKERNRYDEGENKRGQKEKKDRSMEEIDGRFVDKKKKERQNRGLQNCEKFQKEREEGNDVKDKKNNRGEEWVDKKEKAGGRNGRERQNDELVESKKTNIKSWCEKEKDEREDRYLSKKEIDKDVTKMTKEEKRRYEEGNVINGRHERKAGGSRARRELVLDRWKEEGDTKETNGGRENWKKDNYKEQNSMKGDNYEKFDHRRREKHEKDRRKWDGVRERKHKEKKKWNDSKEHSDIYEQEKRKWIDDDDKKNDYIEEEIEEWGRGSEQKQNYEKRIGQWNEITNQRNENEREIEQCDGTAKHKEIYEKEIEQWDGVTRQKDIYKKEIEHLDGIMEQKDMCENEIEQCYIIGEQIGNCETETEEWDRIREQKDNCNNEIEEWHAAREEIGEECIVNNRQKKDYFERDEIGDSLTKKEGNIGNGEIVKEGSNMKDEEILGAKSEKSSDNETDISGEWMFERAKTRDEQRFEAKRADWYFNWAIANEKRRKEQQRAEWYFHRAEQARADWHLERAGYKRADWYFRRASGRMKHNRDELQLEAELPYEEREDADIF